MKKKLIALINIMLVASFVVTAVSGVQLYMRMPMWDLHLWSGLAMVLFALLHFLTHTGWYVTAHKPSKSFEIILTDTFFLIETVTGLAIYYFFCNRIPHSHAWGEIHTYGGFALLGLGAIHTLWRLKKLGKLL